MIVVDLSISIEYSRVIMFNHKWHVASGEDRGLDGTKECRSGCVDATDENSKNRLKRRFFAAGKRAHGYEVVTSCWKIQACSNWGTSIINFPMHTYGVRLASSFLLALSLVFPASAAAATVTIGETAQLATTDSGNANLIVTQVATLSQTATVQSVSFYVGTAAGSLRLGIYDAAGPGGGPGALKAQTNSFTPVAGWNTQPVITPVSLPPGNYWLAYFPSSNSLTFRADFSSGSYKYANATFGAMPNTFPTVAGSGTAHWSLYSTLDTSATPDTTPPSVSMTAPLDGASVSGSVSLAASSTDNVAVAGVQFLLDGANLGTEITTAPYTLSWDTTTVANGAHTLAARARDTSGNVSTSTVVNISVSNPIPAFPIYRASGTFTAGTGAITPPYPAGMTAGDVCLLVVESENQAISLSSAQGFAQVPWSPQSAGTAATNPASRLAVFWKRTVGADAAPTVADSGDHTTGQIHCFRNVVATGNPWDTGAGGNDNGANDTSGTIPGASTSFSNTLVVLLTSSSFNGTSAAQCAGWSNANLANITERADNTNTAGLGGGSCLATGERATAGDYGTTTVTLANTTYKGAISIALKSPASTSDTNPPSVPANLAATPVSMTRIDLAWASSTDNIGVAGYQVFRNGIPVATTTSTSYSDTGLVPNTAYSYAIAAFDAAGNVSAQSAPATASTLADTTPPSVPANLAATGVSTSQVNLSWAASTDNVAVTAYLVFRDGVQVATTTSLSYADTGLAASTTYAYTVAARDGAGNTSAQSAPVNGTTMSPDTTPPSAPSLASTGVTGSTAALAWSASSDNVGVAGYVVMRDGSPVATTTATSYTDTGLTPSTMYAYSVVAFDAAGNVSGASNLLSVTTSAQVAAVPTLIQHVASSANPPTRGTLGNNFKFTLPNAVGAGNTLILGITYPHGSTPTITDTNGNTWPASPAVSADAGSGKYVSSIFVLPNANAGITTITVSFPAQIIPFNYTISEFSNIASVSPVSGTSAAADRSGTTLSAGSFTPANNDANGGNLVWNYYAIDEQAQDNPSSWTPGTGFTLLDADIAWFNNDGVPHASQYLVQTASAPINPSVAIASDTVDHYNAVAVALKAAAGGTNAQAGIRINKIIHQTTPAPTASTITLQEPATGNLRVIMAAQNPNTVHITSITDSDGSVWTQVPADTNSPQIWYAANRPPNPNLVVTLHVSPGSYTLSALFYDISGAAASPFDTFTTAAQPASGLSVIDDMPIITPHTTNGLVLAVAGDGHGPVLGFDTGAPAGAVFDFVNYTGEVDLDLMENADAQAHVYNATTATEHWNWRITNNPDNGLTGTAAAFIAATTSVPDTAAPSVPSGLSGTGTSPNRVSLSWNPSTDNVGVAGYQVFRDGVQIGTSTSPNFADTGLATSTSYSYAVNAFDAAGNVSANSGAVSISTLGAPDTTAPSVPANLQSSNVTSSSATVSWGASTDNVAVTGYQLFRNGVQVATTTQVSYADSGLSASTTYSYAVAAFDAAGNVSAQSVSLAVTTAPGAPFTIGETAVLSTTDSGNGNLLLVQNATLSQAATLQSLSFDVKAASGNLRLGIYDATGPGGGPGNLLAQTNSFVPVLGWNTQPVMTPVALQPGNYWLAYLPSSSSLQFLISFSSGSYKYANVPFGAMPATFPAIAGQGTAHWSFYGTLTP